MLLVAQVKAERCIPMDDAARRLFGIDMLNVSRSDIPAVDFTSITPRAFKP